MARGLLGCGASLGWTLLSARQMFQVVWHRQKLIHPMHSAKYWPGGRPGSGCGMAHGQKVRGFDGLGVVPKLRGGRAS